VSEFTDTDGDYSDEGDECEAKRNLPTPWRAGDGSWLGSNPLHDL
jgi:hypothetical protein